MSFVLSDWNVHGILDLVEVRISSNIVISLVLATLQRCAPSESTSLSAIGRDRFIDVRFEDGEAEGAEVEDVAFLEVWPGGGWGYGGAVGVVGLPL